MPLLGIKVTEKQASQAAIGTPTKRFSRLTLMGWSTAAEHNEIVRVTSLSDFTTRFPSARPQTVACARYFFANTSRGTLQFVSARDPNDTDAPTNADDPIPKDHLVHALTLLKDSAAAIEPTYLVIPEFSAIALQADRTEIFSAAEALSAKKELIHLINSSNDVDTVAETGTESALYSSTLGHSVYYYGFGQDTSSQNVPASAIAGTLGTILATNGDPYLSPTSSAYPAKTITSLVNPITTEADYETLKQLNVNVLQDLDGKGKFCVWGARTLSPLAQYRFINSRIVLSLLVNSLREDLAPFVFSSDDAGGATRRGIMQAIISRVNTIFNEGGLNGETLKDSYRLREFSIEGQEGKSKFQLYVLVVGTVEEIEVEIFNTNVLPDIQSA